MQVVVVWDAGQAYGDEVFNSRIILVAKNMQIAKEELTRRLLKDAEAKMLKSGSLLISFGDYSFSTCEVVE